MRRGALCCAFGGLAGLMFLQGACGSPASQGHLATRAVSPSTATSSTATAAVTDARGYEARVGGGWVAYPDGVSVRVTKMMVARFGDYSSAPAGQRDGIRLTVAVRNASRDVVPLSMTTISVRYGDEGRPAAQVFGDEENDLTGFTGSIPVGDTWTEVEAFSVPRGEDDLSVSVTLSWDRSPALFRGEVKW